MRLRESIVERDRAAQRFNGEHRLAVAVVGECKLVEDAGRTVVERDVAAVHVGRALVASHRDVHIAQQLQRPRRRRVQ